MYIWVFCCGQWESVCIMHCVYVWVGGGCRSIDIRDWLTIFLRNMLQSILILTRIIFDKTHISLLAYHKCSVNYTYFGWYATSSSTDISDVIISSKRFVSCSLETYRINLIRQVQLQFAWHQVCDGNFLFSIYASEFEWGNTECLSR